MIQQNKIPKNILLSLWPRNYLLFNTKDKQPEDILFLRYYYNQSEYIKTEINNISDFEKYKFLLSSYRFNGNVANVIRYYYLNPGDTSKYYFKYQASNANDSINVVHVEKMRSQKARKENLTLSNIQTTYLSRFIDTCAKYNINLVCYYMPMLNEDTVLIKQGVDFINKITAEKNIPLLTFTDQNAGPLFTNRSFWVDGEHMNEKGGAIQSAILSKYVKGLLKE